MTKPNLPGLIQSQPNQTTLNQAVLNSNSKQIDQTNPNQNQLNQSVARPFTPNQTKLNQTQLSFNQTWTTKSKETKQNKTLPNHAQPIQSKLIDQTKLNQTNQTKLNQTEFKYLKGFEILIWEVSWFFLRLVTYLISYKGTYRETLKTPEQYQQTQTKPN